MAKASINFQRALRSALRHNDRTEDREPEYLLPVEYRGKNEVDRSATEAEQLIADMYQQAKDNYREKIGQKLQAKSYVWEAVVNLNKEHTLNDVQRLAKAIEEETGFTPVQIAIHRDEGRVDTDKNGNEFAIHNYHAHITFFTLDRETGEQRYRRQVTKRQKERGIQPMSRDRLSMLQDLTARVLRMERGEKGSNRKRMGHKEYKQAKKDEERARAEELAKVKDLQEVNRQLREQLKQMGAKRAQYAELESSMKELRARIKGGEGMTQAELIEQATDIIDQLRDQIDNKRVSDLEQGQGQGDTEKDAQIADLKAENQSLRYRNELIRDELTEAKQEGYKLREELAASRYREETLRAEMTELTGYKEKWHKLVNLIRDELGALGRSFIDKVTGNDKPDTKPETSEEDKILERIKAENAAKREQNAMRRGGIGMKRGM